ncbi:MAG TPA: flagellin lysine-N-methylase [Mobilitalea sp.]|nr:flagellin lysine-N-methylase [Mobilitalea sp.]
MKYIVPEYYKHFVCKCGECRHSCCDGWPIRISRKEYYHLLGIECSDKLRTKLDCALKLCHEPGNGNYAEISNDWRGICMLHREDGLCALQAELGANSLPEVCRLYPRNTKRLIDNCECSCSNSCEKVVELLINYKEPLRFEENELSISPEFDIMLPPQKYDLCIKSRSIIQDRSFPLSERFISLGNLLYGNDIYSKRSDNLSLAFQLLHVLDKYFESSISICDYCKESQDYYSIEGKEMLSEEDMNLIAKKHKSASDHLEVILPNWQIVFEELVVNHMFYNDFPYTGNLDHRNDAFLSLAAMYSFLRFNILGFMSDKTDPDKLVDFLAAMFRLIEHSNFKYIAMNLLKKEKYSAQDCVPQLLLI